MNTTTPAFVTASVTPTATLASSPDDPALTGETRAVTWITVKRLVDPQGAAPYIPAACPAVLGAEHDAELLRDTASTVGTLYDRGMTGGWYRRADGTWARYRYGD